MPDLNPTVARAAPRPALDAATLAPLLLAALYLAVEIFLFSIHEPWNDEAQAWLKAKELVWPAEFLVIPGEGHPPVWYWLLRLLSYGLSFDQARMLMLGVTALNAWLLTRLLGDRPVLLLMLFCSLPVLHAWGFHFRPYPLILTAIVVALLADRDGRPALATWILALACGLSFLSGWLLAFWLVVQLQRRTPLVQLLAPSILAALFGLSAVLSSSGNVDVGLHRGAFLTAFIDTMAACFPIPVIGSIVILFVVTALLTIGLRRTPLVLLTVLALWALFGLFGAYFYGLRDWHTAFALMLVLMAFQITRAPVWPLLLLLLAPAFWGFVRTSFEVQWPTSADEQAYLAVLHDAGDRLDTERNLVAWPDHALTPSAARYEFRYISGNSGAVVAAIDLRSRQHDDVSREVLAGGPSPYWLICFECRKPLTVARIAGRQVTEILPRTRAQVGTIAAYRID